MEFSSLDSPPVASRADRRLSTVPLIADVLAATDERTTHQDLLHLVAIPLNSSCQSGMQLTCHPLVPSQAIPLGGSSGI